ncbi:hypothetical protein GCM10027160_50280 [Streptomyces calidiresistens]
MLHIVLRRRRGGESVEQPRSDPVIPTGKRTGRNPSAASIHRALAEHAEREAHPDPVEQGRADFAAPKAGGPPARVRQRSRSPPGNHPVPHDRDRPRSRRLYRCSRGRNGLVPTPAPMFPEAVHPRRRNRSSARAT